MMNTSQPSPGGQEPPGPSVMNNFDENEIWTAPQLAARLAALKGVAPRPACHVIYRATIRPGSGAERREWSGYELPEEAERRDERFFEHWLLDRDLAGAERLSVSVLVIRETLDEAGLVREGVLERRRGGADGPLHGKAARVEFTGAACCVRQYQALRDGRLVEAPVDADAALPGADDPDATGFAGEDAAVHAFLGSGAVILDRRAPTLFEDLLGLSGIVHARRGNGSEIGCGVGWHGTVAFVLAGAFPQLSAKLLPPPDLAAAVEQAARTQDLIVHETRLDDQGFCVIARKRGERTLLVLRREGEGLRSAPYVPASLTGSPAGSSIGTPTGTPPTGTPPTGTPIDVPLGSSLDITEDQRRWVRYAGTYEARTVLDAWRNGDGGEIAVLTVDTDGEAWRHIVDTDGIELSRRSDNEAAAAVLHRERLTPPVEEPAATVLAHDAAPAEQPAPAGSLLTKARAYMRVTVLLHSATEACSADGLGGGKVPGDKSPGDKVSGDKIPGDKVPRAALEPLRALAEPLAALHAVFSAGSLHRLIRQAEAGTMTVHAFVTALEDLVTRLRDELALTRIVLLPSAVRPPDDEPPFGAMVEMHFPAAVYDIEEAVHCLALRRTTASVLHAMRVMRHGLRAVERLLAAPRLADLAWSRQITVLRTAHNEQQELIDALIRVRRVWRAPGLMPADKYTEEEAEAVLEAVAAFMRAVAVCSGARGETPGD